MTIRSPGAIRDPSLPRIASALRSCALLGALALLGGCSTFGGGSGSSETGKASYYAPVSYTHLDVYKRQLQHHTAVQQADAMHDLQLFQ